MQGLCEFEIIMCILDLKQILYTQKSLWYVYFRGISKDYFNGMNYVYIFGSFNFTNNFFQPRNLAFMQNVS